MLSIKNYINNLKYKWSFIKVLWSPFKPFRLKFYFGPIAMGVPYFLPRRWIENKDRKGFLKAVPKKIGIDFRGLGYKTKWVSYRYEYSPLLSIVFIKWQLFITAYVDNPGPYWEAWLTYEYKTDKGATVEERLKSCMRQLPNIHTRYTRENKEGTRINYYQTILKSKYLKLINNADRN